MKKIAKKIPWILCLFCLCAPLAADEDALRIEGYQKDKPLPSWVKDVRRAEIITFGSLPFTTLGVTLAYSLYRYAANDFKAAYIPNPFPLSSSEAKLNTSEQIGIISAAAVLSVAIGLTDFIVIKVKENRKKNAERIDADREGLITVESIPPPNDSEAENDTDAPAENTADGSDAPAKNNIDAPEEPGESGL